MPECKYCSSLEKQFGIANKNRGAELIRTYDLMKKLYDRKDLTLYMSDTPFERWDEEVRLEKHYTYHAYLKCRGCGKIYYLGVCIRGVPEYHVFDWEPDKAEFMYQCLRNNREFYE